MTCDPGTSKALIDRLFISGSMGLCLFDAECRVVSVEGAARIWAPPVGALLEEAHIFVGMKEALLALRNSDESLLLSGVTIGSDDSRALDLRVLYVGEISLFAAVSHTATERNQLQFQMSQIIRDNRLLEEKVREQQEKIAEQAELMRLFIRHVPATVAMVDSNLDLMMLSQRWIEEFGDPGLIDDPDVRGSPLKSPGIDAALRLAMDTGVTSSRVECISRGGSITWKRWEQTPWRKADRSVGGSILYFEDMTDEIRKTADLRAQTREMQRLNETVRVLGRVITKEMRAPLREIDDAARGLSRSHDDLPEQVRSGWLGDIVTRVDTLNSMLDALRRYLAIVEYNFVMAPFDLAEAVEIAADEAREEILATGARVNMGSMLSVNGDLSLIALMFRNLIENALRHTGGAPIITIDCRDEDDMVIVRVTDDGPGIKPHLHNRAFEPFNGIEQPTASSGNGMGLAEARKIAERHGGTLVIDPGYDLGLRVLINLPHNQPGGGGGPGSI